MTDADRSAILAAARAAHDVFRRGLRGGILALLVCAAVAFYRPSANALWVGVGVIFAVQLIFLAFEWNGARITSPTSPTLHALLDEPARVAAIEVRRTPAVLVYLDRRTFTVLRPSGDVAAFVAMLRGRCPQAATSRPPSSSGSHAP